MSEKVLTFVVASYNQMPHVLPAFVHNLLAQSWDNWVAVIVHDGPSTDGTREFMGDIISKYPGFFTYVEPEVRAGNWGHRYRHTGLMMVDTPWVTLTNADNQYCYDFVHHLMGDMQSGKWDCLQWWISHSYFGFEPFYRGFGCGATDLMQFAVRTEMAQAVGFTSELHHADGIFVDQLKLNFPNMRLAVHKGNYGIHN